MSQNQYRRMKYYAKKVFNAPREGLELAWARLTNDRTKQDVYRLSYDISWFTLVGERTKDGWEGLIAQRA